MIQIRSDYSSVLSRLSYLPKTTSFTTLLHQVLQEIRWIILNYKITLILHKILAYQDNIKNLSKLSFIEHENTPCYTAVKELILQNRSSDIPFPFELHLAYFRLWIVLFSWLLMISIYKSLVPLPLYTY